MQGRRRPALRLIARHKAGTGLALALKNPGAAVAAPGVDCQRRNQNAAALAAAQAAALRRPGIPVRPIPARYACLQGKALRAIPAALCVAPLDTAEPALPDRQGQRPAAMGKAQRVRRGLLRQVA